MRMPSVYISLLLFFTDYFVFVLAYKFPKFKSLTWLEAKHRSPYVYVETTNAPQKLKSVNIVKIVKYSFWVCLLLFFSIL